MSIVVPKEGRLWWAGKLFNTGLLNTEAFKLQLFKNNVTPDVNTVRADLTPATFTGYASYDFPLADNGAVALSGNMARTLLTNDSRSWTCTASPDTIYGWFLTNDDDDTVLLAERYASPHVLIAGSVHTLFPYVLFGKLLAD